MLLRPTALIRAVPRAHAQVLVLADLLDCFRWKVTSQKRQACYLLLPNGLAYAVGSPVVRVTAWQAEHASNLKQRSSTYPSRLLWWDEAPAVLQFNPYVKHGYRAGQPTCCAYIPSRHASQVCTCVAVSHDLSLLVACRSKLQTMLWQRISVSQ